MAGGPSRRERKVVTVVFCDLVGFTAQAETMDPEDVDAFLEPYHERLRSELERYGGTVEKFIGDAVMALFGAPVAHEDDPERAVRACLAIRDWAIEQDDVQVRLAVTTGEALIRLDARPAEGTGMASGDVVNTAARLQNAAPVNGILADETTYRATRQAIDFAGAAAVEAKGKAEPVPVWQALQAHARRGVDVAHERRSELVGRDQELSVLRDAFERARSSRTSQLVTLVGVPGIGKSRLVYELFSQVIEPDPELITWRQGRCLAYGEGVTLWALGEIVKAQAGVHEQDALEVAAAKVRTSVESALQDSADVPWVESNLLALVGLAEESELGGDRRGQAFSAWRHYFEGMAEQRTLVLVFEDLHWADESLLDFVDELVDWVAEVPLLVLGTARPELLERRPGWGGGKLNATTLALRPLSDEQTALLLAHLLERPVLAAEEQQALLERAGGNPLYAEQFADLFLEQGATDELRLPETLQGIIAARIDGLPPEEKELLRDAAVVGKVFWVGSLSRDANEAGSTLHSLERKGFVRRQKRTSVEGEAELAFAHALVRDVAYGQIARPDRVEKHRQVARWIEALGRPEDHAEMLAHHWRSAFELAQASGRNGHDLAEQTRFALRAAGDRAFALNSFPAAVAYYSGALELWPDDEHRPELLFKRGHALFIADDDRAEQALTEARDGLLEVGDAETAAEAEAFLAQAVWYRGQRDAANGHLANAQALVADRGPSTAKARVLCVTARNRMLAGDHDDAIRIARDALALAEELSLDELRAHALTTIGTARASAGHPEGVRDIEQALEIAISVNSPIASTIGNNLGVSAWLAGDLRRAGELYRESLRLAERFGDGGGVRWSRGNVLAAQFVLGEWGEAATEADEFILECESSPHYLESSAREVRGQIRLARGDTAGALADFGRSLELARDAKDPQALLPALLGGAIGRATVGDLDAARRLAEEAFEVGREHVNMVSMLARLSHVASLLGIRDELKSIVEQAPNEGPLRDAALAAARGDFCRAADIAARMGALTMEARHRLSAADELIQAGLRAEGEAELERALAFFRSVGATLYIERGEALLAKTA